MVRWTRVLGGIGGMLLAVSACAESEDLNNCPPAGTGGTAQAPAAAGASAVPDPCGTGGGSAGTGGSAGSAATCSKAPDCGGCTSCFDVCVCWGTDPNQCLAQCGSGGSSGAGASGGASGSGGGFGGTGGGFGGTSGGFGGSSGGSGTCCTPSLAPGCSPSSIASCVCAQDDYCCNFEWDSQCVEEVDLFGCGSCGAGGSGGGTGCSVQLQEPVCSACMEASCCAQAEACFNNAGCGNLATCISTNCPSAATIPAISTCADTTCAQFASAKPLLMSYLNCLSSSCSAQCGI